MVTEQITATLEAIKKIEASLNEDISNSDELNTPSKDQEGNRRRLSEKLSSNRKHERGRSVTLGQKMDTTMMSEIEYLNFLPDIERIDIDDSSFLKGSFVDKTGGLKK